MRSVAPWYIYAMLGLLAVAAGISRIVQGNMFSGGLIGLGGLLVFGMGVLWRRHWYGRGREESAKLSSLDVSLIELKRAGKTSEAVRHYRLHTGCDLMEAKVYVDSLTVDEKD